MCMREISPCGCKTHFLAILMLIRRKPVKKKEELVKNAVFSLLADTKSKELGVSFFFFWATFITNHKKTPDIFLINYMNISILGTKRTV